MTRILLTNDDGIDAPGLVALADVLSQLADMELWIVAPDSERSACSHGMSLKSPIRVEQRAPRRYAHSGLVADGVYFAAVHLMKDTPPDLVVSGINKGGNLSEDVIYSGTVAGAREAVLRNITGLSISLTDGDDFSRAAIDAASIITRVAATVGPAMLLNLNYPAGEFTGPYLAPLGTRPYEPLVTEEVLADGSTGYRVGGPAKTGITHKRGTDVDLIDRGMAALTPLLINQSDRQGMDDTRLAFLPKEIK